MILDSFVCRGEICAIKKIGESERKRLTDRTNIILIPEVRYLPEEMLRTEIQILLRSTHQTPAARVKKTVRVERRERAC